MRLFNFLIIFLILFSFIGCENKISDIDGTWERFDTVWKFENGIAYINGAEYEFYTNNEKLILKNDKKHREIPYFINNNVLEINGSKFNKFTDKK